jgi:hypothetical protein
MVFLYRRLPFPSPDPHDFVRVGSRDPRAKSRAIGLRLEIASATRGNPFPTSSAVLFGDRDILTDDVGGAKAISCFRTL